MGSGLAQLKSLGKNDRLCRIVKTLVIEDDCAKLDPWVIGDVPEVDSSHHAWLRNDAGVVAKGELDAGVLDLVHILREKLLRPTTIRIRTYQIADDNFRICPEKSRDHQTTDDGFRLCPEMAPVRKLIHVTPRTTKTAVSVGGLAKNIVEQSNLAVTRLNMRSVDAGCFPSGNWDTLVSRFDGMIVLGPPKVEEATIELFDQCEGEDTSFSMLRSVDINVKHDSALYWLDHIFYKPKNLENLSMTVKQSLGQWLVPDRVVPGLREFTLSQVSSQTPISVEDLLAMIAPSKESLTTSAFVRSPPQEANGVSSYHCWQTRTEDSHLSSSIVYGKQSLGRITLRTSTFVMQRPIYPKSIFQA